MDLKKVAVIAHTTVEYMSPELLFLAQSGQPYRGTLYIHFISMRNYIQSGILLIFVYLDRYRQMKEMIKIAVLHEKLNIIY